jgi:hypothetical protein
MGAGGKLYTGTPLNYGQNIGAFFDAVVGATPYKPIVVSRRRLILNEVTSVNVGQVPDSQRRRRRSQDEARVLAWTKP